MWLRIVSWQALVNMVMYLMVPKKKAGNFLIRTATTSFAGKYLLRI
jgi:hypothetical protein